MERLTDLEWTTCWMAIRYAMNRQTIAASTLPEDIIKAYYHKFTDGQKEIILRDLEENDENEDGFGDPKVDRPTWLKFWGALNKDVHYEVDLIDGTKGVVVFEVNGRLYPLEQYIGAPHAEIYVPREAIKK